MTKYERTRLDQLLLDLQERGYETIDVESERAVIRNTEYGLVYVLTSGDEWVQAMQMMFDASQLQSPCRDSALTLALRLHSRFLGCRFGFDDEGNLAVQYDIYPEMTAHHIASALGQVHYVGSRSYPLFEEVLAGTAVDEERIDRAFSEA